MTSRHLLLLLLTLLAASPASGQGTDDPGASRPPTSPAKPDPAPPDAAAPGPADASTPAGDGRTLDDFGHEIRDGDWLGAADAIWEARLFHAGDTAIHVNQLVIALLVLLAGLYTARITSRLVRLRLLKLKRIDAHAALLIQRIVYYMQVVIIVMLALPIAGIPITIFTVIGGAVAIGVGFGAQNLFNNLISSFIIMIERPIRIGDIIQVGDVEEGRVEEIGNRCTRVRRSDGMDVLIPNSQFLENPVVNWTLFDRQVRGTVVVGVAYGSPTDQVTDLILRAANEHDRVLRQPGPSVLFEEFGDNALIFKLMFWADITAPMQLRVICSDLRHRIDHLFRDARITISFPQRDIHLDSLRPIEVRMVHTDAPA